METDVYDPWANSEEVAGEYGFHTLPEMPVKNGYAAVVVTVAHRQFDNTLIKNICSRTCVVYDVKAVLDKELVDARL
jgi:UDP-N-acetyl-D-galactosamine dehydrogenase